MFSNQARIIVQSITDYYFQQSYTVAFHQLTAITPDSFVSHFNMLAYSTMLSDIVLHLRWKHTETQYLCWYSNWIVIYLVWCLHSFDVLPMLYGYQTSVLLLFVNLLCIIAKPSTAVKLRNDIHAENTYVCRANGATWNHIHGCKWLHDINYIKIGI